MAGFLVSLRARIVFAVLIVFVCFRLLEASALATTLTFDELPFQSVNGLTIQGVTFSFTVGGAASSDAFYNSQNGPGPASFVQTPDLEGNANGVLTLDFATPTSVLQFGVALAEPSALTPGFTVQLFDASLNQIATVPVGTAPLTTVFTEGQFSRSGTPIKRAKISFNSVFPDGRFAFDNLSYNQTPIPAMSVGPLTLDFTGTAGAATQTLPLRISSGSGTVNWTATAVVQNGAAGWLGISSQSGAATANAASTPAVTVNFSNLAAGLYQGTVTVRDTSTGTTVVAQVRVAVGTTQSRLAASPSTFVFTAAQGGTAPQSQPLRISNNGQGNLQWSIPASALPSWLSLAPLAGSSPAGAASFTTLTVNATGQNPGVYQASLPISASGAGNSPQQIVVTLQVVAAGTPPKADLSPNAMVFAAAQGGIAPLPQTLTIGNSGAGGLTFNLSATTTSGGPWLGISVGSGSTSLGPAAVVVSVNTSGLLPGFFHGKITATFSAGGSQEIEVLLVVAPAGTFLQRELPEAAACGATSMDMVVSSIGNGLSLPVSFPRSLLAQLVDNCGGNVTNATVVANIGTLSIVLQSVGGGLYSGTWTPESAASSVTLAFTASHPTLGTAQRSFTVSAGAAAGSATLPLILPDGVVEGAGFTALRPLAPGSIISVFGTSFAAGDNVASRVPLDRSLGGVSVRIGSEDAPLYYAGPTQVNAQVPFTVHPGETVSVVVNANGRLTAPQNYLVAPNQPGIFQSAGTAAVLDSHFAQISTANPARIGDTIQIFANGLGLVDQTPATGNLSPPFSVVQSPVTVTVGGVQVPVQYQGLAPGFVGLYQVNVVLTSGVPTGDGKAVVITQNGIVSNPTLPVSIPIR